MRTGQNDGWLYAPHIFPTIPKILPRQKALQELVRYCENENLYLIVGCDSNAHHSVWGSTNCNRREEALVGFLNSYNVESLNQGNEATFCSGGRVQVIDITLGSLWLLERALGTGRFHQSPHCRIIHIFSSFYGAPYRYA